MRHRRRILWIILAVLLVAGAITTAVLLRKRAAPDVVRLLPNADAILYVNLEPVRLLTDLGKKPPTNREPDYEEFVRQTGFEFERDLDRAALAIHYGQPKGKSEGATRYSEILQGHFDGQRITEYLRKLSKDVEHYRDFDIYIIPLEGRTLRVVLLGVDTAAASNTEETDAIHGMVDRYKQAALPFAGPDLVRDYYARVPLGSVVWTIAQIPETSVAQERSRVVAARIVEQPVTTRQYRHRFRAPPERSSSQGPGPYQERKRSRQLCRPSERLPRAVQDTRYFYGRWGPRP